MEKIQAQLHVKEGAKPMFFHLHYVSLATRKATDKEIDHLVDAGVLVVWLIRGFRPVTQRSLHLGADSCSPALNASSCSSCSVCCILIIEVLEQSLLHPLKALVQGLCHWHSSAQGLFSGQHPFPYCVEKNQEEERTQGVTLADSTLEGEPL